MASEQSGQGMKHAEWLVGGLVVAGIVVLVLLFRSQGTTGPNAAVEATVNAVGQVVAEAPTTELSDAEIAEEIFGRLSMFKVSVSEYWMSMGQPPANNDMVGLADPESYAGHWVDRIEVLSTGVILVNAHDRQGEFFRVELQPDYNPNTGIINWNCFSSPMRLSQCTYKPEL